MLTAAVGLLSGCVHGTQADTQPVTLRYYSYGMSLPQIQGALEKAAANLPGVTLEPVEADLSSLLDGENPPDFYLISPQYNGTICSLEDIFTPERFTDLDLFLSSDTGLSLDDYVPLMEAGIFEGKRLALPLCFGTGMLVTSQQTLDLFSLNVDRLNEYDGFLEGLRQYAAQAEADENARLFFAPPLTGIFFPWNGLDIAQIKEDSELFRPTFETYRSVYAMLQRSWNQDWATPEAMGQPMQEHLIFGYQAEGFFWMDYYAVTAKTGQTPLLYSVPSAKDDHVYGNPSALMAINKNSDHQQQAYLLMKQLLSDSVQSSGFGENLPVRRESIVLAAKAYAQNFSAGVIPDSLIEQFSSKAEEACFGAYYPPFVNQTVDSAMQPYLEGAVTYETAVGALDGVVIS